MSLSFGGKTQKTSQQSKTDPWAPTIPHLEDFLSRLRTSGAGLGTLSPDETSAISTLKTAAGAGNPWSADIDALTDRTFATPSQSGTVTDAYKRLEGQLGDYASGAKLDVKSNPFIADLLSSVSDDTQNRITSMFAGAGRDFSGAHTGAIAKGITSAQLPVLANLYQDAEGKQIDAAKTLYGAGVSTGTNVQGLDKDALETAMEGVGLSKEALAARNYGPETILKIEELAKRLPVEQLGMLSEMLYGAAGLGEQKSGTAKGRTRGWEGKGDVGTIIKGVGSLFT